MARGFLGGSAIVASLLLAGFATGGPRPSPTLALRATYDTGLGANGSEIISIREADGIAAKLKKGLKIGKKTFKVHLDGFNLLPHLTGKEPTSPRKFFIYFTDEGDVAALRYDNWKILFMEQRVTGTLKIWQDPFVTLRAPYIFNLRTDPYERAQITSNTYYDWMFRHIYMLVPAQAIVGEFLATFKEFPPRQKAASFSLDQVVEKMTEASKGA